MFCTKCGKEIKEGQKFCTGCGAPVQAVKPPQAPTAPALEQPAQQPTAPVAVEQKPAKQPKPPKQKGKGGRVAAIVVGVIALVLIAALLFFWFVVLDGDFGNLAHLTDHDPTWGDDPSGSKNDASVDGEKDDAGDKDKDKDDEVEPTMSDYDFTEMSGVYYISDEPGSTLELSALGRKLSILKTVGEAVDIQTLIDAPDGPAFTVEYGGRAFDFTYYPKLDAVTVEENGHTFRFTADGNLSWPDEVSDPFTDPDAYILPTDTRYITEDELYDFDSEQVKLIRNEIYARHGYSFTMDKFSSYFRTKNWYHEDPNVNGSTFGEAQMNEYEKANVTTIKAYENRMGW